MGAETELSRKTCSPDREAVPSDRMQSPTPAAVELCAETKSGPSMRGVRRAFAVFQFGLQGIYMMAAATLVVLPLLLVPSCSAIAWPILKTLLILDALAYVVAMGGLLFMVERHLHSRPDGA